MPELDTIKQIDDLRKIWPHEAADFTPWLAEEENLKLLSSAINIDIVLDEVESAVGGFNVDLYCHEDITNRKIVIENQLEDTNHDHLGKIITYAAGKSAEILIWIVKRARDEHRQAVEWLNEHTDDNIGVFLVEIQILTIGNSKPAPMFNVIERPNDWAKTLKTSDNLKSTQKMDLAFWQGFRDYANEDKRFKKEYSTRKAQPHHWYDLAIGNSLYHISLTINTRENKVTCGIYIRDSKELYARFESHRKEIEEEMNLPLEWKQMEGKKASSVDCSLSGDVTNENEWNSYYKWLCDTAILFKKAFKKWE